MAAYLEDHELITLQNELTTQKEAVRASLGYFISNNYTYFKEYCQDLNNNALHTSVLHGKLSNVRWLLEGGKANIRSRTAAGDTAFLIAAWSGHVKLMNDLLDNCEGCINDKDYNNIDVWDNLLMGISKNSLTLTELGPLLRRMLLLSTPTPAFEMHADNDIRNLLDHGRMLRDRLPMYQKERESLIRLECPALQPP